MVGFVTDIPSIPLDKDGKEMVALGINMTKADFHVSMWELSDADMEGTNTWRIKPKLHMVLEMLEVQSKELGQPRGLWEKAPLPNLPWGRRVPTHIFLLHECHEQCRALVALGVV